MYRITSASFRVLAQTMAETGVDMEALFADLGFKSLDVHRDPKGVRLELIYQLMSEVAQRSQNPDYGLLAYSKAHPGNLELLGYAIMSSATLGVALQKLVDYHLLIGNGFCFCLEQKNDQITLIGFDLTRDSSQTPRSFIDAGTAQILGMIHWLLPDQKPQPLSLTLTYPEPADTSRLTSFLGHDLTFNAPYNSITFNADVMAMKLPTASLELDLVHAEHVKTRLNEVVRGSMAARVRRTLAEHLAQGIPCGLDDIALALHLSKRSLQHGLDREGVHFSGLQDEARLKMAHNFLRNSMRSLKYIAALLGFRDQSSFNKACLRWFGVPPGQYREPS
ncbi:AraC family transcriptional regulator ligand-binding domain-containing protein [Pseudomonas sp. NPDC089734]|uniref:AraC family transcriptional regulator n=1 Tax=Pseudomonas sp. NPDC089734 TaxID=3364469 RepID=UPI0037FE8D4F